jgi:Rad3-related DNA helicase
LIAYTPWLFGKLDSPGPLFQELADECRTVILASGSLAPIPSLCAELNLFSSNTPITLPSSSSPSTPQSTVQKRLQTQPPPLEADHVVNLDKQLFVASIGHFPDGSDLQGMELVIYVIRLLINPLVHFH